MVTLQPYDRGMALCTYHGEYANTEATAGSDDDRLDQPRCFQGSWGLAFIKTSGAD